MPTLYRLSTTQQQPDGPLVVDTIISGPGPIDNDGGFDVPRVVADWARLVWAPSVGGQHHVDIAVTHLVDISEDGSVSHASDIIMGEWPLP